MNSDLNPEAPEFYPHLSTCTTEFYTKVTKTVKVANHLPGGVAYKIFETYDDFGNVCYKVNNNVAIQTNEIVVTELPTVKLKPNDLEYSTEQVIDANDMMLDRININIDNVCRVNAKSQEFAAGVKRSQPWSDKPLIAKVELGNTTFIGAKNIARPQLTFKDPVDNSDSLWVPKISDKPNSIKPLSLNILYNDEGSAVGYEHPYQLELELYQPPAEALLRAAPPAFPPPLACTPLTIVASERAVDELVEHLLDAPELAVDVEHHSYRTYQGITCLIQISTYAGDFIIDTLAVREHVYKLNQAFTDPKKIKVFHGAESDVKWLQRDFGVYVVGMFDTYQAARELALPGLSLKWLLQRYCSVEPDKKHQLADWRIRPLPDELVEYARTDTHYLLYIWRRMRDDLLERAHGSPADLLRVFYKSKETCMMTYNKYVVTENSHVKVYLRSKKSFNSRQMAALRLLYRWRDENARALDESITYLLPNHMLLALAEVLPREVQGIGACCHPMPPFIKQNLCIVHKMILSCRELPLEPQLYQLPATVMQLPQLEYNVLDLTYFNGYEEEYDYPQFEYVEAFEYIPQIPIFAEEYTGSRGLNVDALDFIPPYQRYTLYRNLVQDEELREFKEKEAKITAIAQGNELINSEVLSHVQEPKALGQSQRPAEEVPCKPGPAAEPLVEEALAAAEPIVLEPDVIIIESDTDTSAKRKRKLNKRDRKNKNRASPEPSQPPNKLKTKCESLKAAVKPFNYINVNYRKLYDDSEAHKQTKIKHKKNKSS